MMRSLYTGVSGLRNHQTRMDVLSNNIANVNTIGYKGSRTVFADTLSQTMQGASGPSANLGGVNAKQIGLGMKVSAIDIMFTPTSFQTTNKVTDLAINNNGFFVVRDGAQQFYTRAGNFDFDSEGNMIQTGSGLRVMGWPADANGNINSASPIAAIVIPTVASMPAKVSTEIKNIGNLKADEVMGGATLTTATAYDSEGIAHNITQAYYKIDDNTWLLYGSATGVDPATKNSGNPDGITGNLKLLKFDSNGLFQSVQDAKVLGGAYNGVITGTFDTLTGSTPVGGVIRNVFETAQGSVASGVIGGVFNAGAIDLDSTAVLGDTAVSRISFIDEAGIAHLLDIKAECTLGYNPPGVTVANWQVDFYEQGVLAGSQTYSALGNAALPAVTLNNGNTYTFAASTDISLAPGGTNDLRTIAVTGVIDLNSAAALGEEAQSRIAFSDKDGIDRAIDVKAKCTLGYNPPSVTAANWELEFYDQGILVGSKTYPGSPADTSLPVLSWPDGTSYSIDPGTMVAVTSYGANDLKALPWPGIELNAHAKLNDKVESAVTFTDENGAVHVLGVKATCTSGYDPVSNPVATWKLEFFEQGKLVGRQTYPGNPPKTDLPAITLADGTAYSFNPATTVSVLPGASNDLHTVPVAGAGTNDPFSFQPQGGVAFLQLNGSYGALTQYAGDHTAQLAIDGYTAGILQDKAVDDKGVIVGIFSNGQRLALGQLATAIFVNQSGLERAGNTTFRESNNSGTPQIGVPGSGGRGTLQAGVLEMANVDLAEEFTNMIVTQRGFQANSRTITTSDEMLQELMSLKR